MHSCVISIQQVPRTQCYSGTLHITHNHDTKHITPTHAYEAKLHPKHYGGSVRQNIRPRTLQRPSQRDCRTDTTICTGIHPRCRLPRLRRQLTVYDKTKRLSARPTLVREVGTPTGLVFSRRRKASTHPTIYTARTTNRI